MKLAYYLEIIMFVNKERRMIEPEQQKQLMLDMLKYVDNICRKNDIKYSLIGGSLIGVIRHHGFIPWDDDIDLIMEYDNYHKFLDVIKSEKNGCYRIFIPGETDDYPLQFAKLINTNTRMKERGVAREIRDYGIFVDIFCYNNVPDDMKKAKKYYDKYTFLTKCLSKLQIDSDLNFKQKTIRRLKNIYISVFGYKRNLKKILKLFETYTRDASSFVMSNNPLYGFKKEMQLKKNIEEYIDADFEGLKVMIFKNYDEILRTTYGDYMKLPPKSEQIPKHNLETWWKEEENEKDIEE